LENALEIYWNKKRALHTLKYVTQQYSIFDFLLGLGQHFATKKDFHQYMLLDIYEILYEYVCISYPEDKVLKQLVTVDYLMQSKVKPKNRFEPELEKADMFRVVNELKLNTNQYRYLVIDLAFELDHFIKTNEVIASPSQLIIQYNGVDKPRFVLEGELV
ncbi:MAG: DUF4080 domain-containing protein, partial [Bacteroidetes bacterium]|nr:DUF4080 domain-containing protein [Bacteroidota bacterium]